LQNSIDTIAQTGREFGELFGRSYNLLYKDGMDDADIVIVSMGSLAMEAIAASEMLREEGYKTGVLGLRLFRPFPKKDVVNALRGSRAIMVFEKDISYGQEGATCSEIKSALYGSGARAAIRNFIVGLGGRDVTAREMADAVKNSLPSLNDTTLSAEYPQWICHI
jgi:pyruvate/2-oxoacid:ferredoxin oxidoreductase alpha subunit